MGVAYNIAAAGYRVLPAAGVKFDPLATARIGLATRHCGRIVLCQRGRRAHVADTAHCYASASATCKPRFRPARTRQERRSSRRACGGAVLPRRAEGRFDGPPVPGSVPERPRIASKKGLVNPNPRRDVGSGLAHRVLPRPKEGGVIRRSLRGPGSPGTAVAPVSASSHRVPAVPGTGLPRVACAGRSTVGVTKRRVDRTRMPVPAAR
jgi:hypothetical protein